MTDLDKHTADAVEALVFRLRNRGDGEGQFATDPEVFAQEFMTAMRGRGWRPVDALSGAPQAAPRADPPEEFREALAALKARQHTPEGAA